MTAKLYAVPGSHPCATAERALELKGIPYRRIDLVPVFHKVAQKARFGGAGTVPGLVLDDGAKVHGSRAILRELDRRRPEPRLLPADPDERAWVEEIEAWGDELLQPLVRRVLWWALSREPSAQLSFAEGTRLVPPVPAPLARLSGAPVAWFERRFNDSRAPEVRADLANLPAHLDRVDGWLAGGRLSGEAPTAADLQVAPSVRLLQTMDDLAPLIAGRPCDAWARGLFPHYPGRVPAGALPAEWLPR